jgi:hypothetical protein
VQQGAQQQEQSHVRTCQDTQDMLDIIDVDQLSATIYVASYRMMLICTRCTQDICRPLKVARPATGSACAPW